MKTHTILIVDDNESNIDILLGLLNQYDVLVALSGNSAIEITNEEDIDLILLDIMMPELDGYETCKILKSNKKTQNIPIVFITAKDDEDSIEKAYDVGGIDFVTKPFKPKELLARVKTQLKLKSLIEHLEYISFHDPLTDIYNRRGFFELSDKKINSFLKNKKNKKSDFYGIMIDIDKFKIINDKYGHPFGDKVIQNVSAIISNNLSENSIFGRVGGEEFAIVWESEDDINTEIEIIRAEVEKNEILFEDKDIVTYTISVGVSKMDEEILTLDCLLNKADNALYEAKGSGRNRIVFRV